MAKYRVAIDLCASMNLYIEAENIDDAEKKAQAEIWDEDELIEKHRDAICIWAPEIDEIVEEEER